MNTRRKMFSGLVLAAAALLALSGCKKDEGEKVVLSAEFEQPAGGQKTYINDHSVCWTSDDAVRVNDAAGAVAVSDGAVEVTANDNGYAVAYPFEGSTLSGSGRACNGGSVEIPDVQTYTLTSGGQQKMRSPMAARLDAANGRLYFKNLHSLIRVDVTTVGEAFALESITITSATANLAGKLGFTFKTGGTTADTASAPTLIKDNLDKNNVTLKFDEPVTLAANTVDKAFYLCVAPFTNTNLEIKVTGTPQGGDNAGKKGSYVFNRSGKSLNRSIMAEVKANFGDAAFEPESDPESEPEPFKFSVSADSLVEFSPGNLQYQASNGTWRFAEHQYDYIGDANKNIAQNYTGWIDLFGWGTSGYNSKYPYMTSETDEEYGDGESNIAGTNYDWGKYNDIYNPKTGLTDPKGTWRTLTKDEWVYLIQTRTNASNLCKYGVTVCGKSNCLIIAPDGFTGTIETSYDASAWSAAEAAGLVCLPAAGYRYGASVSLAGSNGYYWSSTCCGSYLAYLLSFGSGGMYPSDFNNRCSGRSVRLVKNVK